MEGTPRRLAVFAVGTVLVAVALVRASGVLGQEVPRSIDGSDWEHPLVALALDGASMRVLVRTSKAGEALPPGIEGVPPGVALSSSEEWRSPARATYLGGRTEVQVPSGATLRLDGMHRLMSLSGGLILAVDEVPTQAQPCAVRLFDGDGETLWELATAEPTWAVALPEAGFVAIGSRVETRVLDRGGRAVHVILGWSHVGAATDSWLAFERRAGRGTELVLCRPTGGEGEQVHALDDIGLALRVDREGRRLTRVGRREVQVWELEPEPRLMGVHPAPSGCEWRSAAFSGQGRLALGWIRELTPVEAIDDEEILARGEARVGVVLIDPSLPGQAPLSEIEWQVNHWIASSPDLGFSETGALFAVVWPRVYEVWQ